MVLASARLFGLLYKKALGVESKKRRKREKPDLG